MSPTFPFGFGFFFLGYKFFSPLFLPKGICIKELALTQKNKKKKGSQTTVATNQKYQENSFLILLFFILFFHNILKYNNVSIKQVNRDDMPIEIVPFKFFYS